MDTPGTALSDFFVQGRPVRYSRGEVIVAGDDPNPDIHYIGRGFVKVYSINDDGEEYVHVVYRKGEIFPLIWALRDHRRRIFYEAIDDCVLWKKTKNELREYLDEHADPISRALLGRLAEQFNIYADRLDNLQYKSAYERVVYRILFLAGRFGVRQGDRVIIEAPITHKLLAQSINLARESVSREFEKLQTKGLIDTTNSHIVINDVKALSHEFSEPVSLDLWGLDAPSDQ